MNLLRVVLGVLFVFSQAAFGVSPQDAGNPTETKGPGKTEQTQEADTETETIIDLKAGATTRILAGHDVVVSCEARATEYRDRCLCDPENVLWMVLPDGKKEKLSESRSTKDCQDEMQMRRECGGDGTRPAPKKTWSSPYGGYDGGEYDSRSGEDDWEDDGGYGGYGGGVEYP